MPKLGWTSAIKLRAGDILVLSNGEYVVVEKVQHEILESPVKVYNFEVEDFHTYFVGESSILVHNDCKINCAYLKEKYHDHIFSNDHIKNGIMDLGNTEDEIMDSGLNIIRDIDKHGLLQEGSSQIWTHINEFDVEIRTYVKQGELISFDMFKN